MGTITDASLSVNLLTQHISTALKSRMENEKSNIYKNFKEELMMFLLYSQREGFEQEKMKLKVFLKALDAALIHFDKHYHTDLFVAFLDLEYIKLTKELQEDVMHLLISFILKDCNLLNGVLVTLVKCLVPFIKEENEEELTNVRNLNLAWSPAKEYLDLQILILKSLDKLLGLMPHSVDLLLDIVSIKNPFTYRGIITHLHFASSLNLMLDYSFTQFSTHRIYYIMVNHLVALDCHIQEEDIIIVLKQEENEVFEMEMEDSWNVTYKISPSCAMPLVVSDLMIKIDRAMEIVLTRIKQDCSKGGIKKLWKIMLSIFENSIANIDKSKFAQYLLIFLIQKEKEQFTQDFLELCFSKLNSPGLIQSERCSYANYIASFLARWSFVPLALTLKYLKGILALCENYATTAKVTEESQIRESLYSMIWQSANFTDEFQRHEVFYGMFQAALYMLCYVMVGMKDPRNKDEAVEKEIRFLVNGRIGPMIHHHLRPLHVIVPSIAEEFINNAKLLHIADFTSSYYRYDMYNGRRILKTHFPFSPFVLTRSSAYLNLGKYYIQWNTNKFEREEKLLKEQIISDDESLMDINSPLSSFSHLSNPPSSMVDCSIT